MHVLRLIILLIPKKGQSVFKLRKLLTLSTFRLLPRFEMENEMSDKLLIPLPLVARSMPRHILALGGVLGWKIHLAFRCMRGGRVEKNQGTRLYCIGVL